MLKLLPVLVLVAVSLGFIKKEPDPLFKSPRKFYRAGDTVQVTIDRDTVVDVAFCAKSGKAIFYYRIEKQEGNQWSTVYQAQTDCPATTSSVMEAGKGFTIKHPLLDQGTFRIVVSNRYYSSKFEMR